MKGCKGKWKLQVRSRVYIIGVILIGVMQGLYWCNIRVILGQYKDNEKEHGNYKNIIGPQDGGEIVSEYLQS